MIITLTKRTRLRRLGLSLLKKVMMMMITSKKKTRALPNSKSKKKKKNKVMARSLRLPSLPYRTMLN